MNLPQPQVEPEVLGEEVDANKAGAVGGDVFNEEYVTGDVGLKEYDYSYKDYSDPLPETGNIDAYMGPALSAVTDEGGVSNFAPIGQNTNKDENKSVWPILDPSLWEIVFSVFSDDLLEFTICQKPSW